MLFWKRCLLNSEILQNSKVNITFFFDEGFIQSISWVQQLLQHAHPQLKGDISPLKTEHLIVYYCMKFPYERQRFNMAQISMLCRPCISKFKRRLQ